MDAYQENKFNENVKDDLSLLSEFNDKSAYALLPILVTCGVLMLVGIVGNSLVVYVYWRKMKGSAKRTFILALAILDLSVCTVVIPFEMFDLRNQAMFYNNNLCKAARVFEYATVLSAGFVLVSVSFERYYFLCKAFNEFTSTKAKVICVICVAIAMIVSAPSTFFAGSKTRQIVVEERNITGCECSMNSETHSDEKLKKIYYYCLGAIFGVCIIMFVVLYTMIGRLLWKYQKGTLVPGVIRVSVDSGIHSSPKKVSAETPSMQSQASESNKSQSRKFVSVGKTSISSAGSIVVFFSVTVVFILSFLPHIAIRLVMFLGVGLDSSFDRQTSELVYNFTVRSYLISNVANPFIYSIFNKTFRKELKHTFNKMHICVCSRTYNSDYRLR